MCHRLFLTLNNADDLLRDYLLIEINDRCRPGEYPSNDNEKVFQ